MTAACAPLFGKTSSARSGAVTTRVQVVRAGAPTVVKAPARPTGPSNSLHPAEPCTVVPKITVQKQGDAVTSIRIECPCGQVIDLACEF